MCTACKLAAILMADYDCSMGGMREDGWLAACAAEQCVDNPQVFALAAMMGRKRDEFWEEEEFQTGDTRSKRTTHLKPEPVHGTADSVVVR